jgi:iron complex transport system ATP-binding protein
LNERCPRPGGSGPALLELRDVRYVLGSKTILDGVSWRLSPGEHWAILGPNGAGKTTLLRLACGYVWPNAGGTVLRMGKELLDLRELRRSIGWVTADLARRIPRSEPVLQSVVSGKFAQVGLWGLRGEPVLEEDNRRARAYLEELGAGALAGQPFATLSQGETQKVLIARARMARPTAIILDEPCAGLDPGAREEFLASLANLACRHDACSLVYVTHHVEEILPAFEKVMVMQDGRIAQCGNRSDVLTGENLSKIYRAATRLVLSAGRYWPVGMEQPPNRAARRDK